jgi:heme-degrading monooxygenase HmoA
MHAFPMKRTAVNSTNQEVCNARDPPVTEHLSKTFKKDQLMPIRVFIKRHIKEGREEEAIAMLNQFRHMAKKQPGYISGETLLNHFDSRSITIVSSWQKIEDWIQWQNSAERAANEAMIESLLEQPTKYEIYDVSSIRGRLSSRDSAHDSDEVS